MRYAYAYAHKIRCKGTKKNAVVQENSEKLVIFYSREIAVHRTTNRVAKVLICALRLPFSHTDPCFGVFVGHTRSIQGVFIEYTYVSGMCRVCIGYVSGKCRREWGAREQRGRKDVGEE